VFHVFLAGGRLEQITALNEPFAEFAKANGCSSLTIAGRKGWEKVLNKLGWKFEFTTLKREI
jgi:N-acyl-L-homoserine lactone synthetase